MGDDDPLPVVVRHVEEQIGEGQVGQQAPLADQALEMIDLVAVEGRVLPGELAKRGHDL